MLFSNIDILDEHLDHRKNCFVGVRDGFIAYIGRERPTEDFGEVYDGRGKLLMSGFYNAHSHSAMTLMRGYGENLTLSDWLNTRIFPFEAKMMPHDIHAGALLAAAEMVRFGIVSTTDMYYGPRENFQAVEQSGIKMNFAQAVTCFDGSSLRDLPSFGPMEEALTRYHGAAAGRFRMDVALHAEYTSTERVARELAAYAKEKGLRMQVHLSETKAEHEECKARHGGRTPAQYLRDCGLFDVPATAAHCVWLEGEDFTILQEKGVTVACNPVSNLKLASGFAAAPKLLDMGVNVALGTDSVASNNNLNIMEEVKLFATLFKATTGDPTAVTPKQALYAATRAGALSQGREDCGLVKEGFRADLIVLDMAERPYLAPCHNVLNNVVFSALGTDVCLTMVDGKVLYRDGAYTTIDVRHAAAYAAECVEQILTRL